MKKIIILILINICFVAVSCSIAQPEKVNNYPDGFVDLSIIDSTIIYDMRYFTDHNFLGTKVDGYECAKCILTKEAAIAVSNVQKELKPFGLTLKVYDCFRPQMAVDHFVRWAKDIGDTKTKKEFYPDVDKSNLFKDGYIAERSSHSRGSTIDLTIVPLPVPEQEKYYFGLQLVECYKPAKERFKDNTIDMGTGFDCFDELSHTENLNVTVEQRVARNLLRSLMDKYGFKNYDMEWWHYTLKNEPYPDTYFNFPIK